MVYGVAAIPMDMALALKPEPLHFHQPRIGTGLIRPELLPKPIAESLTERVQSFAELKLAHPSPDDAASTQRGVVFRVESNGGRYLPPKQVVVENGTLPALNDGEVSRNDDDLARNVWYDGQGRFSVDLLKPLQISEINTYSWHHFERAPQFFTVWASKEPRLPATDFNEAGKAMGWTFGGLVNTHALGDGGVHISSLRPTGTRPLGPFRYLLWITEDNVRGTFFTEIDGQAAGK